MKEKVERIMEKVVLIGWKLTEGSLLYLLAYKHILKAMNSEICNGFMDKFEFLNLLIDPFFFLLSFSFLTIQWVNFEPIKNAHRRVIFS